MKIFLPLAAALLLQSCIVSTHPKMAFFDNPYYQNSGAKFMSVNVPMFLARPIAKNALRKDRADPELIALLSKVSDVKMMTVENGSKEMLADFSNYLNSNNFEEWMTVKKDTETISFQAKKTGNSIRRLMLTVNSGSEMVYIDVRGHFTPEDISRLINYSEKNDVKKIIKNNQ